MRTIYYGGLAIMLAAVIFTGCTEKQEMKTKELNQMVVIPLSEAAKYAEEHPGFASAFEFLRQPNLADLQVGRYELAGDSVFCLVSKGPGKTKEAAKLEAHQKYVDIQYVIAGDEQMGWKPTADCQTIETPYSDEKDIIFYSDAPSTWTTVPPGSFTIFYPKDAHAPMVGNGEIHKVVCKILIEQ